MSVTIQRAGLLDTIQDLGRAGLGMHGISQGGAMDRYAAEMANYLVGNNREAAVIEIHFPGPQIVFEQDALISITGADLTPVINEQAVSGWRPIAVRKGSSLHFTECAWGARAYLAFHGGLSISKWLNSYSTHLKAGLGGWKGRKLEKGDELPFDKLPFQEEKLFQTGGHTRVLPWAAAYRNVYEATNDIYFIIGKEWEDLEEEMKDEFLKTYFSIQSSSDRMGYQLQGEQPLHIETREILSSAVSFGTLQLLPGGQLIVLMADHQTTGGYPRLGHVISAHLPKLAQLSAGAAIRFSLVDITLAEELYLSQHKQLKILQRACNDHLNDLLC